MTDGIGGGLENFMVGQNAEKKEVSAEEASKRNTAARAQIHKVQKDEGFAQIFDIQLARIIPKLPIKIILFVAFLIEHNVPGLTILSILSLSYKDAHKVVDEALQKYKEEACPFAEITNSEVYGIPINATKKIEHWWQSLFFANNISTTVQLSDLQKNHEFIQRFSLELSKLMLHFLAEKNITEYHTEGIEKIVNQRGRLLFFGEKKL